MNTQVERFEEVFNAGIKAIHEVNVTTYGSVMANLMFPAFESLKPVFKATYDQGVKDQQEKLEGCVVVPERELETCYYDECEGMYLTNHDFLKNIDAGEVVEVKRQYYWETTPLFAAITWDGENKKEGSFQIFNSHDEADKAAAHCKAMLEAARGGNE